MDAVTLWQHDTSELQFLIQQQNAVVATVGHEDPATFIDGQVPRPVQVLLMSAGRAAIATGNAQTRRDWVNNQLAHSVHISTSLRQ